MTDKEKTHIKEYSELEAKIATTVKNLKELPAEDNPERVTIIADNVKGYKLFKRQVRERCDELQEKNVEERKRLLVENKKIKTVADDLIDRLEEPIAPWIEENKKIVDAEEERKRVKREAKLKRVSDIKARIQVIVNTPVIVARDDSNSIGIAIEVFIAVEIEDGSFEEFEEDAVMEKQIALEKLNKLYEEAKAFEDKQAYAKVAQKKLDEDRKAFDKQKILDDAQRKEDQVKEDAARKKRQDAEDKERADRKAKDDAEYAKQKSKDDAERKVREDKIKAEDKVRAEEQTVIDEENKKIKAEKDRLAEIEQKRIEAENKVKKAQFEKDEAERQKKEAKAKLDADIERNEDMRDNALHDLTIILGSQHRDHAISIIKGLEMGNVCNVNVEWKLHKEKK